MNPIYKFILTIGSGESFDCRPVYGDDLAKEFERESNQQFFRAKLSGKLTFQGSDYAQIAAAAFDTKYYLEIMISYDGGIGWSSYWWGSFFKTDCEFDADAGTVRVTPTVVDQYDAVLAGMEKEYNLIDLAPEIVSVEMDKRPMIQVYIPGQSVVGCFLSGMWWGQECSPVTNTDTLKNRYFFAKNVTARVIQITPTNTSTLPSLVYERNPSDNYYFDFVSDGYRFLCYWGGTVIWQVISADDPTMVWERRASGLAPLMPYNVTLSPGPGSTAEGTIKLNIRDIDVYARYVLDVTTFAGEPTYQLPSEDLVANNRNYSRAIGYAVSDVIYFSDRLTNTPTSWGIYQPGQYYLPPDISGREFYPVARSAWSQLSIWFSRSNIDWAAEPAGRAQFTLKDAYPLWSVISVLLRKIAPGITHANSPVYSDFLYGSNNPIMNVPQTLLITPKSNVINAGYDQPAQKAMITLKEVMDMLRDCFRCYWYIDSRGRFCIEHVQYFMDGGGYGFRPLFGINLTREIVSRNGKRWAFARNQYQFDKPAMAARYEFGWMDEVTQVFEGYPIDIISQFVDPDNIEQVSIARFTSDVDYILLNPEAISKDGFVLLSAVYSGGAYRLPYYNFNFDNGDHILQNAYVAFIYLQRYYAYDMPAPNYEINGESMQAEGVKKLKLQEIRFPALRDPNMFEFVKTDIGNGMIQKLSVNLSSRNAKATLMYDTE